MTLDPRSHSKPSASRGKPEGPVGGHAGRLALGLAVWVVLALMACWGAGPPRPKPIDAPAHQFSAERAFEVLRVLRGDGRPHPAGSVANDGVIDRLQHEIRKLGLKPVLQETFVVAPNGRGGNVRNVTAVASGKQGAPYIMISVHHDSVGAGPGVSDDLAGIATALESVRALRAQGAHQHGILLLFTDAEEVALGGAEAFALENDLMSQVACTINLEARGTSGPSRLFETGPDSAHLVRAWSRGVSRPSGTSIATDIYKRLGNDSDLSVFRAHGMPGLNFAFIGDVHHYHTPGDDLDNLDLASLQHHGENVLGVLRSLMTLEHLERDGSDDVYFDLFGRLAVVVGERTVLALMLLCLCAVLWGSHLAARDRALGWGRLALAYAWLPFVVLAPVVLAEASTMGLSAWLGPDPGNARPWAARLFAFGCVVFVFPCMAGLAARSVRPSVMALASFGAWGFLGLLVALFLPGGGYLFLGPMLAVSLPALGVRHRGDVDARFGRICLFALGSAVVLWTPVQLGLEETVGTRVAFATTAPLAALGTLALPLLMAAPRWMRRSLVGVGFLMVATGLGMVLLHHGPTEERPQRLTMVHVLKEDGGISRVLERPANGTMEEQLSLGEHRAEPLTIQDLNVEVLPNGTRKVTGRIQSLSGALHLFLQPDRGPQVISARFEGRSLPLRPAPSMAGHDHGPDLSAEPTGFELFGLPDDGYAIEWIFAPGPAEGGPPETVEWITEEEILGLDPSQVSRRPAHFVPSGRGDRTRVMGRLTFEIPTR